MILMVNSLHFSSVFPNQNLAVSISLLSFDQLNKSLFKKIVVFIIRLVIFLSSASNSSKLNCLTLLNKSNREACQI